MVIVIKIMKIGIVIIVAYNKIVSMTRIMVEMFATLLLSVITKVVTVDLVLLGKCQSYNYA